GVLEVVLGQPLTELELLLGKYVGQVLFLWIALVLTVAIPLGLTAGSHPQWGVVIAQYVGAGLLTLGLAGVGVWASSVTRNQITAFIAGVAVMFVLTFVGLDPLLVGLPPRIGAIAGALGVLAHLDDLVTVRLFASAALPPEVAFLKRDVDDLLRDYRAASGGKLRLVVADPSADTAAARVARTLGIPPVQFNVVGRGELQVKDGYLGIAVQYAEAVKT